MSEALNAVEHCGGRLAYDTGELPADLPEGKDIDLLFREDDLPAAVRALRRLGFREVPHPNFQDDRLYGAPPRRMFRRRGLLLDLHLRLVVRSLDAGQWVPLDAHVQHCAWQPAMRIDRLGVTALPVEVEACYLLARGIFDKRAFSTAYCRRIQHLLSVGDIDKLRDLLGRVVFRFTPDLLGLACSGSFDGIPGAFRAFAAY